MEITKQQKLSLLIESCIKELENADENKIEGMRKNYIEEYNKYYKIKEDNNGI